MLDQPTVGADPGLDRALEERRIAKRLERNPEDAVREGLGCVCGHLERESRLPAATRSRQRKQAVRADELTELLELSPTANERRLLDRQIRPVQRLQRRKLAVSELVQMLRRAQVLEPVLAEVAQFCGVANELSRRRRDEDLAAMTRTRDPRAGVNVEPDVALSGDLRLAGVEAHSHPHRPSRE